MAKLKQLDKTNEAQIDKLEQHKSEFYTQKIKNQEQESKILYLDQKLKRIEILM